MTLLEFTGTGMYISKERVIKPENILVSFYAFLFCFEMKCRAKIPSIQRACHFQNLLKNKMKTGFEDTTAFMTISW